MYSKKDILKTLNEYNYFIEETVLDSFIKNWKIDPIYEDEDGVEFFDNFSIVKLKKGISLKSQGYDNGEIMYHINKILTETPAEQKTSEEKVAVGAVASVAPRFESFSVEKTAEPSNDVSKVTIDVTNQTLQMLADAVAGKITNEIKQQLQCSDFIQPLLLDNPLKEKNEELSKKVDELLEDNKKLAERVQQLESGKFSLLNWLEKVIVSLKK